jgi:glycosyltransferase involved in cell wall biosynthesis
MRIVLVEFTPSGGLYQFALQLGEALAGRGHQVDLLTGPRPEFPSSVPGLTVHPVLPTWHPLEGADAGPARRRSRRALRMVRYVAAYGVVRRFVRQHRPDVVQWSNWKFPLDGPLVEWVGRAAPAVMLDLAHTPRPFNEQRRTGEVFKPDGPLRRLQERAYARMDAVLVLGERSRADMLGHWPSVRRVEVVPHGDESIFRRGVDVPPPSSAGQVVLFFGNLATYKGLDTLLDAFAVLRTTVPGASLVIAGAPAQDVDAADLVARATAMGAVDLRLGYVAASDVAPLFCAARVVAAPYRYANGSGVVSLAATFGRPVVASDVGDLPAAVRHDVTGLLVPPERPAALADALAAVLSDPALADRLGAGGARQLALTGSWPEVAAHVEAVYASCLAASGVRNAA